jgi:HSP20 family molecular chaperone IbpA
MNSLFSDLLGLDNTKYFYSRPTKDRFPYWVDQKEDGKINLVINAVGVSEKDVQVEVKSSESPNIEYLVVKGESKNDWMDTNYSINMTFSMYRHIEEINWYTKDGLLYLEISLKQPVKPSVKINRLSK